MLMVARIAFLMIARVRRLRGALSTSVVVHGSRPVPATHEQRWLIMPNGEK
jgi:hypothetical protein